MLDHLLAILLLAVVPARALWRSKRNASASEPKTIRYLATIGMVAGLLSLLLADWALTGRSLGALGLAPPVTAPALVGLSLVAVLLLALRWVVGRKWTDERAQDAGERWTLMPDTAIEKRLFLMFALTTGFGWELLYRGFLLHYLQPHVDVWLAVGIAALAYGVAHGFKSQRQISATLAVSVAFTLGYAITDNLWWLILLHVSLPMLGLAARAAN